MATPMTADRFVSALKAEEINVVEHDGWRTHNRNSRGPWGPVNGIVIHHTAGRDSKNLVWSGTAALPGPLCHTYLSKNGLATMIGNGRTNHAGTFASNAHSAVVSELPAHPRPDLSEPVDGNAHYYGIEVENLGDGKDPYPAVQYQAAVRWAAAICRAHGWSENSVIGHKEGTRRKIDPTFDMDTFRKDVAERLKHPADWTPNDVEDDMTLSVEDAKVLWLTDGIVKNPNSDTAEENPYIAPATGLRNIETVARRTETRLAALQATIDELVKVVVSLSSNVTALDPDALIARIEGAIENVTIHLDVPDA